MQPHKPSLTNKLGKTLAKPLGRVVCSPFLREPSRLLDIYLNFLMGKGSGTGWDIREEVQAAVRRIKRPQPVVFDVGANVGTWTACLLEQIPTARVFMFDPSPGCQAAIRDKQLAGTTLVPCALGETCGRATFHFSSPTDGSASLHARRDTPFQDLSYQETNVEVSTIDHMLSAQKIDFVDFMKMDVEGHELFTLRGGSEALRSKKIGALSFEFGCGNVNSRTFFRDYWELLTGAGFALWRITPGGQEMRIEEYYEDLEYFRGATNYVAALNGCPAR